MFLAGRFGFCRNSPLVIGPIQENLTLLHLRSNRLSIVIEFRQSSMRPPAVLHSRLRKIKKEM